MNTLTDPSGRPYKPNEEQREAFQAEFYRTNAVPKKEGADYGNNPESAPDVRPLPEPGAEDQS